MADQVEVCPYCLSTNISAGQHGTRRMAILNKTCEHCGYTSYTFPKIDADEVPDEPIPVEELPDRPQIPETNSLPAGVRPMLYALAFVILVAAVLTLLSIAGVL